MADNQYSFSIKSDEPYPSFATLDLKLDYRLNAVTLHLSLNNLGNTAYFDRGNIPQPGFWLTGGIRLELRAF
jgi:iron complex outermembrane receptor protein